MSKSRTGTEGEVAILVSDHYQGHGLGAELLRLLIQVARDENLQEIVANILPEDLAMRALANRFDFRIRRGNGPGMVIAVLAL
jgi:acetyltransferase